ncbi:nitrilase [Catalinimonas alkaloidigena]|uniref:carbon-nitrogen hydrolase family protein n=1 Tax=Catalinimonas alkaloidigena TaxID=1075417 RepID=UPI002405EFFC|nr:carbon-nitrogen hydrolase family protein [Catalinimonas alkaloidigena]MDF9799923.1 nitrilase [Catalinimonas alkaloidigena]
MAKIKVGIVQDSPVFFDKEACLQKVESITKKYAREGCQLLVFPESFIPGYPRAFAFGTKVGSRSEAGRKLYAKYHQNAVDVESNDLLRLEKLAKEQQVYLAVGLTEKNNRNGSLYCSLLYISPKVGLMGVHRKIKPTGQERVIWAEAGGESLISMQTRIGRIGGLICWENYMPLARMSMYRQGVEIYIAPTADARPGWQATMQHIALEGRCFVLASNQYFKRSMYPEAYQELVESEEEVLCRGGSVIISPMGEILAGPLYDQAGVLSAEITLEDIISAKLDFDVDGHYARPDIFELNIQNQLEIIQEDELLSKLNKEK